MAARGQIGPLIELHLSDWFLASSRTSWWRCRSSSCKCGRPPWRASPARRTPGSTCARTTWRWRSRRCPGRSSRSGPARCIGWKLSSAELLLIKLHHPWQPPYYKKHTYLSGLFLMVLLVWHTCTIFLLKFFKIPNISWPGQSIIKSLNIHYIPEYLHHFLGCPGWGPPP